MPIFAYHCPDCGHDFDALQKVGAETLTECPNCCSHGLRKLLSAPNFHLKGKGWRKTEEKNKPPARRPRFAHTFDSPVPHADHHTQDHDHPHDHPHGAGHSHKNDGHKQ